MLTQLASAAGLGALYYALLALATGTVSLPLLSILLGSSLIMSKLNKGWGVLHKGLA